MDEKELGRIMREAVRGHQEAIEHLTNEIYREVCVKAFAKAPTLAQAKTIAIQINQSSFTMRIDFSNCEVSPQ